ncbi:MAG: hypothetical protein L0G95_14560 [Planococcus sp. (in: firmicutes)]|uniref:hypothetical protein n=1 Tax=Planococcus alpniumensis TaxID=2708345 RepID=UPI001B8C86BC|nr:hypothetical protein [Planococcus sp. MSAK28401]MDN5710663.1 hypothetical protein [Planococcus sp. (in: firmicutes)]
MLKKNMKIALVIFIGLSVKDYFSQGEIHWGDSLLFASMVFAIYLFLDWTQEPYDWSKHKR